MPTNVTPEYAVAHRRYLEARTRAEKIAALEEMISTLPKHKGTDHLFSELKAKLAKLKSQKVSKAARHQEGFSKQGDATICIVGLTQSGKSSLLSMLTNARPKISNVPYTTTRPVQGIAGFGGSQIQVIEIPSTFSPIDMSMVHSADCVVILLDSRKNLDEQRRVLADALKNSRAPRIEVVFSHELSSEKILQRAWKEMNYIRVYTKEPGKKPETRAMVLKKGASVKDACMHLHQDFVKFFKYARVWGSAKVAGQKVGMEYALKEGDIVEIHI